jgi:hypothetical protein
VSKPNIGRICLECEHCWVWPGHGGYSEYTPTSPFDYTCFKGHDLGVDMAKHQGDKASMLKGIRQAETCPDFEVTKP